MELHRGWNQHEGQPGERARVARVRFTIVPDTTTRALELRKGSADLAINAAPTAFAAALIIFAIPSGLLATHIGRKPTMALTILFYSLFSGLTAMELQAGFGSLM